MKRRGFTLVELLVVIAIIGTLAAVGTGIFKSVIARSREAACLNNLRSLGVALESYLQEHNQKLPDLAAGRSSKTEDLPVLDTVLLPYVENPDSFKCPQDTKEYEKSGSSYLWNFMVKGKTLHDISYFGKEMTPDKVPLITDKESWHPSGTNFLYADQTSSNKARFAAAN